MPSVLGLPLDSISYSFRYYSYGGACQVLYDAF